MKTNKNYLTAEVIPETKKKSSMQRRQNQTLKKITIK